MMKTIHMFRTCAWVVLLGMPLAAGCKEDPPPPSPDTKPAATDQVLGSKDRAAVTARPQAPRVSVEATKLFRADACYFGAVGLRYARDAYLASLGGAEPGPGKIPSFGEYDDGRAKPPAPSPEEKGKAEGGKGDGKGDGSGSGEGKGEGKAEGKDDKVKARNPVVPPLPFNRHVRSCGILKTLKKPEAAKLDPAAAEFEKYISKLNRSVSDAHRYYSRQTYDKDEFKRGKELHKDLTEAFGELDKRIVDFSAALEEWRGTAKATDKLDPAGEAGSTAVADARALTLLLLADKVDPAAAQPALDKLVESTTKLKDVGKEDAQAAHPRVLGPSLDKLAEIGKKAIEGLKDGKLDAKLASEVSLAYANVAEAHHRALAQMLRKNSKGDAPAQPLRMLNPRVKGEEEGDQPAKDEPAHEEGDSHGH